MPSFPLTGSRPMPKRLLLLLPLFLAACGEVEDTRPGQPVAHRRAAFQQILKAFEPMGMMLREKRYDPEAFLALTTRLDGARNGPWEYFLPDTDYPPTKATARVWSEGEKFQAEREKFLAAVAALKEAAGTRQAARVAAAYEELHESCRSCHKQFKK